MVRRLSRKKTESTGQTLNPLARPVHSGATLSAPGPKIEFGERIKFDKEIDKMHFDSDLFQSCPSLKSYWHYFIVLFLWRT